ncbi:MAG: PepSY-associated TM helix domain-containing protein [Litorimonas sp.]
MKRRYRLARDVHGWAGAVLSALLCAIALTGTLLVFKSDYLRATLPAAAQSADLSVEALARVTERAEDVFGAELRVLVYADETLGVHRAYLTNGRSVYLDGSGRVVARWDENGRFEDWLFDLHHRLLLGDLGLLIAGLGGLAASGLVLTGLYAVWPMRLGLRRGLRITRATRQQLRSLHRNLGVMVAAPALLFLSTGAVLSFPAESRALFDLFGGSDAVVETGVPSPIGWSDRLTVARQVFPTAEPRMAIWPRGDTPASLRLRQPEEWHPNGRTSVAFGPDGVVGRDALSEGVGRQTFNAVYPLHAAKIGGGIYKWMTALSGLGIAALSLLGLFSFAKRFGLSGIRRPVPLRQAHEPDL